MFPDDLTLIARGKYSTLNKERREQLQRVRDICSTIVTEAHQVLRDCEGKPPSNESHLVAIDKCMVNLRDAREKLITVNLGLIEIEPDAWGKSV